MNGKMMLKISFATALVLGLVGCSTTPELDKNFSNSVRSSIERQRINSVPSGNASNQTDAIELRGAYNAHVNSKPVPIAAPMVGQ